MLKNDKWIIEQSKNNGMIQPFIPGLVNQVISLEPNKLSRKVVSFGTSSYGYDLRLSPNDFRVFKHVPGEVVDPKRFNSNFLEKSELYYDEHGEFFIIPGNSYALGVALERLEIPDNITVICVGKSTYARCGIIANLTPAESGWKGNLTLEFSNSSSADARIYANEGIVQLLFLEGEKCQTTYRDRHGKYQYQIEEVTLARI